MAQLTFFLVCFYESVLSDLLGFAIDRWICLIEMLLKTVFSVVGIHLISALLAKTISRQKARSSRNWFLAGLFFGPLGLIAAAGLTDRHQIVYLRYLAESHGYEARHGCSGQSGNEHLAAANESHNASG